MTKFAHRAGTDAAENRDQYLVPVLQGRLRFKYGIGVAIATLANLYFWVWWLNPAHIINPLLYWMVTLVFFWLIFLVFYFFTFFLKAKRPVARDEPLMDARVAMIVTKTPSEPFSLLRNTLEAMLAQDVPHDTWLADEDPQPETIAWCEIHGVRISTRKNRPDYHRDVWPRRTRCKEGNLAFFYDHYGYEYYDFVSQLDADHIPQPGYLREMLKPFANPKIGYVSAPSICSLNADKSWAARTRLYTEAMFHGVFQAGFSARWAPMCIGSHYAVRTSALKEVGGLGPELAEDHSTSLLMNAGGWRGVHAIDAIAFGAGPASVMDMATQEFQWSRSLLTLLLSHTGRYLPTLPPRLKFQFLFAQLWYPIFSIMNLIMIILPIIALVFDARFADVTYPAFVAHIAPTAIILTLIVLQVRRDNLFRPVGAGIFSWEKILFLFMQWPWVLWGCTVAVRDKLTGTFVDFRITPKGAQAMPPLPLRVLFPYAALAVVSVLPVIFCDRITEAAGFYILALINATIYTSIVAVVIFHHHRENAISLRSYFLQLSFQYAVATTLVLLVAGSFWMRGLQSVHALTVGLEPYQITEVKFYISGAGQEQGKTLFRLKPNLFN